MLLWLCTICIVVLTTSLPHVCRAQVPNCKLLSKVQALYYLPGDIPSWLAPREEDGYSTKEERKFRQCFPDHLDVVMYRSLYLLFAAPGYATVAMVVLIAILIMIVESMIRRIMMQLWG